MVWFVAQALGKEGQWEWMNKTGYPCVVVGWEPCAAMGARKGRWADTCDTRVQGREEMNAVE